MIDPKNCIFRRKLQGLYDPEVVLKLNNVLLDTIKIGQSYVSKYRRPCTVVSISGDATVRQYLEKGKVVTNYDQKELNHECNADQGRLIKAWKLLYSKVCTGAKSSNF